MSTANHRPRDLDVQVQSTSPGVLNRGKGGVRWALLKCALSVSILQESVLRKGKERNVSLLIKMPSLGSTRRKEKAENVIQRRKRYQDRKWPGGEEKRSNRWQLEYINHNHEKKIGMINKINEETQALWSYSAILLRSL